LGDVAVLDLDSFTWRRPTVSGNAPSPRELASAVYHAGHMIVFGKHSPCRCPHSLSTVRAKMLQKGCCMFCSEQST
jgi:hypothetical protein